MRWLETRKSLLKNVKQEVLRRLGGKEPQDVRNYAAVYERDLKKPWSPSSKRELLSAIEHADIVYGGDFHALAQAQRTHLRILRSLSDERPLVLALECFSTRSQKYLDAYMQGAISLDDLKKKTKWEKEWGFPWDHYKPLFELAKLRKFKLYGINAPSREERSGAELQRRDRLAASTLKSISRKHPGALLYVIFGDLHLAQAHLPKAVRDEFGPRANLSEIVVHLNSEKIYFDLAEKNLELTTDVVRLGENAFCIQSSPPWVKWQSYLFFLDHANEKESEDLLDDEDDEENVFDATDHVAALVKLAAGDLGVEVKVDDLSVYGETDERIWKEVESKTGVQDREVAQALLKNAKSFYLARGGIAYLPRATVNHAAGLAGLHLHAKLSGRKRNLWKMPGDFKALIWTEAVAYFISKLINHGRKAETLTDLKSQIAMAAKSGKQESGSEALRLVLDMSMSELIQLRQGRTRALQVRPRRTSSYLEAARILGGMMGERLYLAYRSRKLEENELLRWLKRDVSSRAFSKVYDGINERLANMDFGQAKATVLKTRKERL
jgi:Haem-binding uptake, Tiki superfamily, ChaN